MIKMKFHAIQNQAFIEALNYLANAAMGAKEAYRVGRILDKCGQAQRHYIEAVQKAAEKFTWEEKEVELEDGQKKTERVLAEADRQAYVEMMQEMGNEEVEIKVHKVHIDSLDGVTLTPTQLMALKPIIDGIDEDDAEGADQA